MHDLGYFLEEDQQRIWHFNAKYIIIAIVIDISAKGF